MLSSILLALALGGPGLDEPEVGDLVERVMCRDGYEARVFAADLKAPDGLAFDAEGRLCVVEESGGRITRIGAGGVHDVLTGGLHSPEGLCLGPGGEFFVVEDCADGRLLSVSAKGELEVLATHLDAPEGVVLVGDTLFITESNAQLLENKFKTRTRVIELHRTHKGWSAPVRVLDRGLPFSFAELAADGTRDLLLVNEIAGGLIRGGLLRWNRKSQELQVFCTELCTPEGIGWSPGKPGEPPTYPLFVAEENVDGKNQGRISCVDAKGQRSTFASGFGTLEDVLVGPDGRVFVSEDSTGLILELRRKP